MSAAIYFLTQRMDRLTKLFCVIVVRRISFGLEKLHSPDAIVTGSVRKILSVTVKFEKIHTFCFCRHTAGLYMNHLCCQCDSLII